MMNISSDFNKIQQISTQVWNCDEIGFDPNGRRNKVIHIYKFSQVNECGRCKQEIKHHYGAR